MSADNLPSKQHSETPLTDAAVMAGWSGDAACVSYEECQAIERILNDARRELARYESGREVLNLVIDTQRDKIKQLEAEVIAAKQLAVRQGNEILKLRAGERV